MWLAVFAAVWRARLIGATLVFAAIALAEGVFPSRRMALMMGADLLVALTNTSVGLAGATLVAEDRRAGWLLLAPACILLLAYRAYLSERTKHESLEFLYGVARSLSRAPDIESALVDLLRRTQRDVPRRGRRDRALLGASSRCARRWTAAGTRMRMEPLEPGDRRGAAGGASATSQAAVLVDRESRLRALAHAHGAARDQAGA